MLFISNAVIVLARILYSSLFDMQQQQPRNELTLSDLWRPLHVL